MIATLATIALALVFTRIGRVRSRFVFPNESDPHNYDDVISTIDLDEPVHGVAEVTRVDTVKKGKDYLMPYITEDYPLDVRIEENGDKTTITTKRKF